MANEDGRSWLSRRVVPFRQIELSLGRPLQDDQALTLRGNMDAFYVSAPSLRSFILEVRRIVAAEPDRVETVRQLRPAFARLLSDKSWLPAEFRKPDDAGGMGGGIGNYLLYRSEDRDLTLMSLVVPAGAGTPVHDHLAWGLVGLYEGEQTEVVYRRVEHDGSNGDVELVESDQRHLLPGDFYELLPPEGDIHEVRSLGNGPSVSLHLLGNDIGCTWRHRYEPREHRQHAFRSGYSNERCDDSAEPGTAPGTFRQ